MPTQVPMGSMRLSYAMTAILRGSLDLEQALLDFRHFVFEQLADEFRRCA
jgi:hypothetical protein